MSTYLFTYRAPKGYVAGAPESIAAWRAFFAGLGEQLTEPGNPVFARTTSGNCGADTVLGGYSLVVADDLESAATLAKDCPYVAAGGGVEVGEVTFLAPDGTVA